MGKAKSIVVVCYANDQKLCNDSIKYLEVMNINSCMQLDLAQHLVVPDEESFFMNMGSV